MCSSATLRSRSRAISELEIRCASTAAARIWQAPWRALTGAGIEAQLLHAQHVRQLRGRKTDIEDSRWLARVCQFGLGRPSFVPDEAFRDLRNLVRHRRTLVAQRSRVRNHVQKVLDRSGLRIGGVLSDIFGCNGRRILDGLVARRPRADILDSLSRHVRSRLELLGDALGLTLCETDRLLLADLISGHDDLDRRVQDFDRHIDNALADHRNLRRGVAGSSPVTARGHPFLDEYPVVENTID